MKTTLHLRISAKQPPHLEREMKKCNRAKIPTNKTPHRNARERLHQAEIYAFLLKKLLGPGLMHTIAPSLPLSLWGALSQLCHFKRPVDTSQGCLSRNLPNGYISPWHQQASKRKTNRFMLFFYV